MALNVNNSISLSRRFDKQEDIHTSQCEKFMCNPDCTSKGTFDYVTKYTYRRMKGWNIPNFRSRVRKGDLLPHTHWDQLIATGSSNGSRVQNGVAGWYTTWSGNWSPNEEWLRWPPIDVSSIPSYSQMAQMAAANCYEQGFDVLTFLAELTEVRKMFLAAGKKLYKLQFPRSLRELACEWLAYRYGWRTLYYDLKSLDKAVKSLHEMAERTRHSGRSYAASAGSSTDHWESGNANILWDYTLQREWEITALGSVTADISMSAFQFNPVVTAWEIIPFSFVIDWFLGVGKAISASSFLTLASRYAASGGWRYQCTQHFNVELAEILNTIDIASEHGQQTATLEFERTTRCPCNVPYTPHFNLRLNTAKVLDLMALIAQRWK